MIAIGSLDFSDYWGHGPWSDETCERFHGQVLDDLVKSLRLDCPAPRTAPRLLDKQPDKNIKHDDALSVAVTPKHT